MTQQRMAKLFNELADTYDAVGVEFFQPIASGLVIALDPQPGEQALDVGCGRGAVLFPLAADVGPSGSVTGLDLSPRMVQATADDVARAGLDIELLIGDAMDPDLPAGSYDLVASSLVVFFLPDPLVALQAWRELLVEGGRVGVSTFGPYDGRWAETVDAALRAHTPAEIRDARTTGRQGPFGSDDGMEQLLTDAGFSRVRTVSSVVKPRFDDCQHWYDWSMSVGQRQFWQAIPGEQFEDVKVAVLAAVDECRDEHGRIGFDQSIRYTLGER
jgi:ubiquinone/menaquinone biosynthesis C-methylase UbiE